METCLTHDQAIEVQILGPHSQLMEKLICEKNKHNKTSYIKNVRNRLKLV